MATVEDIVHESGVSRSTVFRFLNGSNVRSEAKKSIIEAMEKLNFRSETLKRQNNYNIEISISDNYEGFKGFADVVQGILQRADEMCISVNLCRRMGDDITSYYSRWNVKESNKGVIIVGKEILDEEEEVLMLLSKKIPHVFVNRIFEAEGVSWVSVDIEKAALEAVEHLISLGHKKIAVVGQQGRLRIDRNKVKGLKDAMEKHGIPIDERYIREVLKEEDFNDMVKEVLTIKDRPTAFFAICDSHAMKIMHIARNLGIRLPEELAVIGMDNVDTSEYSRPTLSTVHIPFKKMGILAVDNIIQLISDPEVSNIRTIVSHKLVIRDSSGSKPSF